MPRYPSLFQINTRVWLNHLSRKAGKPINLADFVPNHTAPDHPWVKSHPEY
jgi:hypothetical protein